MLAMAVMPSPMLIAGVHEPVAEVVAVQPGGVADEQFHGGFGGIEAAGAGA